MKGAADDGIDVNRHGVTRPALRQIDTAWLQRLASSARWGMGSAEFSWNWATVAEGDALDERDGLKSAHNALLRMRVGAYSGDSCSA